ncbi:hypothetical protein [Aneurinibacillus sp. REN35]|uniref:hypothetical protein n=1 Tax=Aneurinibacillus sp. REN35 TaxID=3237286 RepID=UPI003527DA04
MIHNMIETIDSGIFEDDVYVSVVGFELKENEILLTFEFTYIVHWEVTEGLIPFGTYSNGKVDWLLDSSMGLFAKAPAKLGTEYAKILEKHGVKTSLLPSISEKQWQGKEQDYKVFIFGDSYVVAKRFKATQLV